MRKHKIIFLIEFAMLLVVITFGCSKHTEPDQQVAAPRFNPEGGSYNFEKQIEISCDTDGATIRYTLDDSEPNSGSAIYTEPILVNTNLSIKAKGYKDGWIPSPIATATYTFIPADTLDAPVFSPAAGVYEAPQHISISCSSSDAVIRYTTDGKEPDESSPLYVSPIFINSSTTLKAKAYRAGAISSPITSGDYTISQMIMVQGGTFHNGASNITLSSFYISNYEITQAQYQAVMGANPSHFTASLDHPVESISWSEAIRYCNLRSQQEGMTPCYSWNDLGTNVYDWPDSWQTASLYYVNCNWEADGYRLPTEMEWLFAALGGKQSHNYPFSGSDNLAEVAWYNVNANACTHRVGSKAFNELGLYDMSGNVWEWTWDSFAAYPATDQTNPHGSNIRNNVTLRGGSWTDPSDYCKVAFRLQNYCNYANFHIGFRVVRSSLSGEF